VGRDEQGVAVVQAAMKVLPISADLLVALAKPLWRTGKNDEALESCEKALEKQANQAAKERLAPEVAAEGRGEILLWLGRTLYASGKKDAGLARLKECVEARPSWAEGWRALAELSEAMGKAEAALKAWRKASELDPTDA